MTKLLDDLATILFAACKVIKVLRYQVYYLLSTCFMRHIACLIKTCKFLFNCIVHTLYLFPHKSLVTSSNFSSDKLSTLLNSDIEILLVQLVSNLICLNVFRNLVSNIYALPRQRYPRNG